ncbi:phosphonate C-P lyase system protein PhnH [Celeribacter indicus]|uniref:Carbon-phosphorus lyase complex subunit n=1 Tax=Celeribacter indicus TaxID=1208324 RepID=A0A0B5DR05_9RHOB|nr:phosphonate C-P lyase system protein PhnH [Celeribacter indicus]AJE45524.1 carbon-phosphorus lyase complex subunit [Celeribacter indicus]SDW86820.1 alpha-D-ribose 1-methylphosphonate 5-triphosphate synthase subunit PhnH [Celeribacter indicus]
MQSLSGGFRDPPAQSARAFRAALEAMARPGTVQEVSGAAAPAPVSEAAATLLLTLCDPETPLCLAGAHDRREIRDWIAFHTGAPLVGAEEAVFALGTWEALAPLGRFAIGTADYPDRSATLIVECDAFGTEGAARLTGPGIRDSAQFPLPDVAAVRENAALFPLGLDFYFTCGTRLAGLPRSTHVEAD